MDLNDYPTERTLPWKPIVLIAGGVLLLVVIVFVAVRLIQGARQEAVVMENGGASALSSLEQCDDSVEPDTCRQGVLNNLAQQQASTEICDILTVQEERDNCYWGIARETGEKTVCARMTDAASSQRCVDDVVIAQAKFVGERSLCEEVQDTFRRERCQTFIEGPLTGENCGERAPETCADLAVMAQAETSLNDQYCQDITDEAYQEVCYDRVEDLLAAQETSEEPDVVEADTDEDADGLTSTQEQLYGTDPTNPDTDGDGFLDGEEVEAGYDPNGPGRLEP